MKRLPLRDPSHRCLLESFAEWLDTLGYSEGSVYQMPRLVREFLHWLELKGPSDIRRTGPRDIETYHAELRERPNTARGGGLSAAHLNKHLQALRKFTEYLRRTGRADIPMPEIANMETEPRTVRLTERDIAELYRATELAYADCRKPPETVAALRSRDRAMLSVFYGLGLRRNEGAMLDTGDVDLDRGLLHVRKGKGGKERFVPMGNGAKGHLREYMYGHRPMLMGSGKGPALFIASGRGTRLSGQGMGIRIRELARIADITASGGAPVTLHVLRHSIATHLLQRGMPMEGIARFLGHAGLESTQIYTHLEKDDGK